MDLTCNRCHRELPFVEMANGSLCITCFCLYVTEIRNEPKRARHTTAYAGFKRKPSRYINKQLEKFKCSECGSSLRFYSGGDYKRTHLVSCQCDAPEHHYSYAFIGPRYRIIEIYPAGDWTDPFVHDPDEIPF